MKVLVNGIGNIGTTILQVLVRYKRELGIDIIFANKNNLKPWQTVEMDHLRSQGIVLTSPKSRIKVNVSVPIFEEIVEQVDYIFDAGANGSGNRNKSFYEALANLKGVSAQGSEKGFGISFMSDVNNQSIIREKFVHIVSCNTHGTAAILSAISGKNLENLDWADFVVVRRSEDLGNHERLVSANVVARHLDEKIGTHHAIDVVDLFKSIDVSCNLTSSDITTPSQLMHAVRFHFSLKKPLEKSEVINLISKHTYLATTKKFDSNVIFEQGRRYGFNGRIFSHAIVISENLLINRNSIKGWAFVPQEGNSIISTFHAFLLQMKIEKRDELIALIQNDLLRREW